MVTSRACVAPPKPANFFLFYRFLRGVSSRRCPIVALVTAFIDEVYRMPPIKAGVHAGWFFLSRCLNKDEHGRKAAENEIA